LKEKNQVKEKLEEVDNSLKDNIKLLIISMGNKLSTLKKIFNPTLNTVLAIIIAFMFSVGVRLLWPSQANNIAQFKYNGELMLTTNDGYFYAEGARDLINGYNKNATLYGDHQIGDLSPVNSGLSRFTALVCMLTPFSLESVIYYLPAIVSSLIVVPIVLIGTLVGSPFFGFLAAAFAATSMPYYNRTMSGYYDTDIFSVVMPFFIIWELSAFIKTKRYIYLVFLSFFSLCYEAVYPQGSSLQIAILGLVFWFGVYEFYRYKYKNQPAQNLINTSHAFIILALSLSVGLLTISSKYFLIEPILVLALISFFAIKRLDNLKYIAIMFVVSVFLLFYSGALDDLIYRWKIFVARESILIAEQKAFLTLHFFNVAQTIREAGVIDFNTFVSRVSGNVFVFFASIGGYLFLVFRHPVVLFTLPVLGLGFLAMFGGVRFAMYASPVLSIGYAFFIVMVAKFVFYKTSIADKLISKYSNDKNSNTLRDGFVVAVSLIIASFVFLNSIQYALNYKIGPVFRNIEVAPIVAMGKIASREDYVVTWWDYGYPLRYYADMKTPSDGAKHDGDVNFPNSYALTHKPLLGAKMTRLNVEYIEKQIQYNKRLHSKDERIVEQTKKELEKKYGVPRVLDTTAMMSLDYGFRDVNDFLISLETDIQLPKKTRDIYFFLPSKMINIFPVVKLFSYLDLMNGVRKPRGKFEKYTSFKDTPRKLILNKNVYIDKSSGALFYGNKKVLIKRFASVALNKQGQPVSNVQYIANNSNINIVLTQYPKMVLVVDDSYYESLYFQLGILGRYDKNLFEPIHIDPLTKIYKLKI